MTIAFNIAAINGTLLAKADDSNKFKLNLPCNIVETTAIMLYDKPVPQNT